MGTHASERLAILGTHLSILNEEQVLIAIRQAVAEGKRLLILSGNVHSFNLAYEHGWLRAFVNQADIVRLDGEGVRIGARILGYSTPPRMTWADFGWDLAESAAAHGHTMFLLGARPGVAESAGAVLQERFPDLRLVGMHHGYFDKVPQSAENEAVIAQINVVRPDILIIGFGMPLQERWLMENRDNINATVILTGGAVFDYISGKLQRAPRWMTDNGLEWLGRLLIEPRRLWRRYILGNPLFVWRVLKQRLGFLHLDE